MESEGYGQAAQAHLQGPVWFDSARIVDLESSICSPDLLCFLLGRVSQQRRACRAAWQGEHPWVRRWHLPWGRWWFWWDTVAVQFISSEALQSAHSLWPCGDIGTRPCRTCALTQPAAPCPAPGAAGRGDSSARSLFLGCWLWLPSRLSPLHGPSFLGRSGAGADHLQAQ